MVAICAVGFARVRIEFALHAAFHEEFYLKRVYNRIVESSVEKVGIFAVFLM